MMRGRHRNPGLGRSARIAVVVLVLGLVAGGGAFGALRYLSSGCSDQTRLTVGAAPEIVPALQHAADRWAAGASANRQCVSVSVVAAAPVDVALALANSSGVRMTGLSPLGTPSPDGSPPPAPPTPAAAPTFDVWVPDSSTWLSRVRTAAPSLVPADARSIATSPVVLAMPEKTAQGLGWWPDHMPTWSTLLGLLTSGAHLNVGIVAPSRDAAGLSSLIALDSAAESLGVTGSEAKVAVSLALHDDEVPAESDLLSKFPGSTDDAAMAAGLTAAPLAEHSLIAYDAQSPAVRLAALYVDPAPEALDYPYAVMPTATGERARLATQLRDSLTGDDYVADLGSAGLRGADGLARFPALPGSPATITTKPLDGTVVADVLTTWVSLARPSRMLAVMDVSGSMSTPVPTAAGKTRAEVAIDAARRGLGLFPDSWSVGLWTFSTNLDGNKDYLQLLPIRPMPEQRPNLEHALQTIKPIPQGDTGLYDTVLAAYQTVQQGWDPASVNSVVLLTDGQNDDANGITLNQLISSLKAVMDPRYPVQVIIVAIGDQVSLPDLNKITNTTGGHTFPASDPSQIDKIFLDALLVRPDTPAA